MINYPSYPEEKMASSTLAQRLSANQTPADTALDQWEASALAAGDIIMWPN